MIGQSGYTRTHGNNPYTYLPELVKKIKERTDVIIFNFHATTSAERRTMAFHADGMVSAMIGTGTRCQTADAEVLSGGTAVITDAGRTGSRSSVFGMDSEIELKILQTGIPRRSVDGWGNLRLQGVITNIATDGKADTIEVLDIPCKEEPDEPNGDGS
jgi:calcineurin-like phosphoesterase